MAYPEDTMKDTISILSALSQMPRASSGQANTPPYSGSNNPATMALEYAAKGKYDQDKENRSMLNQLATQKSLYDLKQGYSDDEEKKRIQKMVLLESNIKDFQASNGRKPSAQEIMVMAGKVGLDIDQMKSLAYGNRTGTSGSGGGVKFHTVEDNGVKRTFVEGQDEDGNTTLKQFASNSMETDADRQKTREQRISNLGTNIIEKAKQYGYSDTIQDPNDPQKTIPNPQKVESWARDNSLSKNENLKAGANIVLSMIDEQNSLLGYSGNNARSGKYSEEDMNVLSAMNKYGDNPTKARGFVDYVKQKTGYYPFSQGTSTGKTQAGPTNAAQTTPTNAADTAQKKVVKQTIPERLGTGEGGQNPLTQHFMDNVVNPVKNALTLKGTVDNYNKEYSPSTQTSGTDKQTQYINTIKGTDFWKSNEDKKGFASMTPSYVKTVLSKDSDLSKQEKKSIWNKLKEEYSTDDKLKELWDRQEKSLDF